jgi:hypothetical protein
MRCPLLALLLWGVLQQAACVLISETVLQWPLSERAPLVRKVFTTNTTIEELAPNAAVGSNPFLAEYQNRTGDALTLVEPYQFAIDPFTGLVVLCNLTDIHVFKTLPSLDTFTVSISPRTCWTADAWRGTVVLLDDGGNIRHIDPDATIPTAGISFSLGTNLTRAIKQGTAIIGDGGAGVFLAPAFQTNAMVNGNPVYYRRDAGFPGTESKLLHISADGEVDSCNAGSTWNGLVTHHPVLSSACVRTTNVTREYRIECYAYVEDAATSGSVASKPAVWLVVTMIAAVWWLQ